MTAKADILQHSIAVKACNKEFDVGVKLTCILSYEGSRKSKFHLQIKLFRNIYIYPKFRWSKDSGSGLQNMLVLWFGLYWLTLATVSHGQRRFPCLLNCSVTQVYSSIENELPKMERLSRMIFKVSRYILWLETNSTAII